MASNLIPSKLIITSVIGIMISFTSCRPTPSSAFMDLDGFVTITGFNNWANPDGSQVENPTGEMIRSGELEKAIRYQYESRDMVYPADKYKFYELPVRGGSAGTPISQTNIKDETEYKRQLREENNHHVINFGVNPNPEADGKFTVEKTAINNYQGRAIDPSLPVDAYYETSKKDSAYLSTLNSTFQKSEGQKFEVQEGIPQNAQNNFDCNKLMFKNMASVDQTGEDQKRVFNVDFPHVPMTVGGKPVNNADLSRAAGALVFQTVEGNTGINTVGQKSSVRPVIPGQGQSTSTQPSSTTNQPSTTQSSTGSTVAPTTSSTTTTTSPGSTSQYK